MSSTLSLVRSLRAHVHTLFLLLSDPLSEKSSLFDEISLIQKTIQTIENSTFSSQESLPCLSAPVPPNTNLVAKDSFGFEEDAYPTEKETLENFLTFISETKFPFEISLEEEGIRFVINKGCVLKLKGASFAVYISFLGFKSADDFVKMIELDLDVVHVKRFLYPTVVMNSLCENPFALSQHGVFTQCTTYIQKILNGFCKNFTEKPLYAIYLFMLWLRSYDTLFTQQCDSCGCFLKLDSEKFLLLPPTIRSVEAPEVLSKAFHYACFSG